MTQAQIKNKKKILIQTWVNLGLNKSILYEIHDEELYYYGKYTWAILHSWFFGDPWTYIYHPAYINEIGANRKGRTVLSLAGGLYIQRNNIKQKEERTNIVLICPVILNFQDFILKIKGIIKQWLML